MVDFASFKKFFFSCLIGSLIIAALVAVITVLIGNFNDVAWRVLFTLSMVIVHSLVSLVFIWDNEKQNTFEKFNFFTNVLFLLIVVSFFVSIFGIWDIVSGTHVWNTYQTFFVILFASLHGDILSKALGKENYLNKIIYANYAFMAVVVIMLFPIIYVTNSLQILGSMYFRILGAAAIIDGTLSILTIIFYKLYANKHPKEIGSLFDTYKVPGTKKVESKGLSIWVWLLIGYIILQVIVPLLLFFTRLFI